MKKYIFTESQIKNVINTVVNEQQSQMINEQEVEEKKMMGIQTFLNYKFNKLNLKVDGVAGPRTIQAIKAYQQQIGVNPDGLWGLETENTIRRNPSEWKLYKTCVEGKFGLVDKLFGAKVN